MHKDNLAIERNCDWAVPIIDSEESTEEI